MISYYECQHDCSCVAKLNDQVWSWYRVDGEIKTAFASRLNHSRFLLVGSQIRSRWASPFTRS